MEAVKAVEIAEAVEAVEVMKGVEAVETNSYFCQAFFTIQWGATIASGIFWTMLTFVMTWTR